MFEKVNPSHPDKIADRIAGAIVDLAYNYAKAINPRIAVEVLIGHGGCKVIIETSVMLNQWDVVQIVRRISGLEPGGVDVLQVMQDEHLAENQKGKIRCGDNGIFLGMPVTEDEKTLTEIMKTLYELHPSDGKAIIDGRDKKLIICQSSAPGSFVKARVASWGFDTVVNPLGGWSGGINVDSGATNRKLGSDMGAAVTGGGLHGKDLSKADVSINIYAHLKAQELGKMVMYKCAIGDEEVDGIPYIEMVETARNYIRQIGGFEKFAEWGLIR